MLKTATSFFSLFFILRLLQRRLCFLRVNLTVDKRRRDFSVFTLGFTQYGRACFTRSVSYVTTDGPASRIGPPCLVVLPSHVAFNICHRTFFLPGLRVQSREANGVVYMKYGGRSDNGEQPPRRRPSTPTLRWEGRSQRKNHNKSDVTRPCGWYESYTEVESTKS